MFLQIDDSLSVEDVQDRFSDCYPFLRLKFYSAAHKRFRPSEEACVINGKEKIGDVRKLHANGVLEIKSWYTVARVEEELKERFGLNAQIFRRNPKGEWIQTSLSDALTLAEQSEMGYDERLNASS